MPPGIVHGAQECLQVLQRQDRRPGLHHRDKLGVWAAAFPAHNLADELDLRLSQLELRHTEAQCEGCRS
eukprot:13292037-Alexandrium_andersonii.AAC.1